MYEWLLIKFSWRESEKEREDEKRDNFVSDFSRRRFLCGSNEKLFYFIFIFFNLFHYFVK